MRKILALLIVFTWPGALLAQSGPNPFTEISIANNNDFNDNELYFVRITCGPDFDANSVNFPSISGYNQFAYGIGWQGIGRISDRQTSVFASTQPTEKDTFTIHNDADLEINSVKIPTQTYAFLPILAMAGKGDMNRNTSGLADLCSQNSGFFFRYDQSYPPAVSVVELAVFDTTNEKNDEFMKSFLEALGGVFDAVTNIVPNFNSLSQDRANVGSLYNAISTFRDLFTSAATRIYRTNLGIGETKIVLFSSDESNAIPIVISIIPRDPIGDDNPDNLLFTGQMGFSSNWRDFVSDPDYYGLRLPFAAEDENNNTCTNLRNKLSIAIGGTQTNPGVPDANHFLLEQQDAAYIMLAALTQLNVGEAHAFRCVGYELLNAFRDDSYGEVWFNEQGSQWNGSAAKIPPPARNQPPLSENQNTHNTEYEWFHTVALRISDNFRFSDLLGIEDFDQDIMDSIFKALPAEVTQAQILEAYTNAAKENSTLNGVFKLSSTFENLRGFIVDLRVSSRSIQGNFDTLLDESWTSMKGHFSDPFTISFDPLFAFSRLQRIEELADSIKKLETDIETKEKELSDAQVSEGNSPQQELEELLEELKDDLSILGEEKTRIEAWTMNANVNGLRELSVPTGDENTLPIILIDLGFVEFGCGISNSSELGLDNDARSQIFGANAEGMSNFVFLARTNEQGTSNDANVLVRGSLTSSEDGIPPLISNLSFMFASPSLIKKVVGLKKFASDSLTCSF